jgi:hypothetical protein
VFAAFPPDGLFAILFFLQRNRIQSERGFVMGARRIRREQRRVDMAESRHRNGVRKAGERDRRAIRMKAILKQGKLPYTPPVLSWLSEQLDKPGRLITQADVDKLLK